MVDDDRDGERHSPISSDARRERKKGSSSCFAALQGSLITGDISMVLNKSAKVLRRQKIKIKESHVGHPQQPKPKLNEHVPRPATHTTCAL